jgi:serine/threonine protein kinase
MRPAETAGDETVLALALERPADERETYLAAACAGHPDRHGRLASLLPYAQPDSENGEAMGAAAALPTAIGGYPIVRRLGQGSMGIVYEAIGANGPVALKLLSPDRLHPDLLRRFAAECQILGRLRHPGIPRILEAGLHPARDEAGAAGSRPFLVMELVHGERLDAYARRPDVDLIDLLRLFAGICDAVHHAHQQGVLHRDLKPSNILAANGRAKVLDFGIARSGAAPGSTTGSSTTGGTTRWTATGQVLGTLAYMSPEQLRGRPDLDTRSDVYSLGVMLYELSTGGSPAEIHDLTFGEAVRRFERSENTPSGLAMSRELRHRLARVIGRAVERDRDHRFRSARELGTALRRLAAGERSGSSPARRRGVALSACGLMTILLALARREKKIFNEGFRP